MSWSDNSDNELGFHVERSTDGIRFVRIGITDANVNQFEDSAAAEGRNYHYRVRAFNEYGFSGYTNTVEAIVEVVEDAIGQPLEDSVDFEREFTNAMIGGTGMLGSYVTDEETNAHLISASGPGFRPYEDVLGYAYKEVEGDFRIVAKVTDIESQVSYNKAGLMVRQSLSPDSRHAAITLNDRGRYLAVWRDRDGEHDVGRTVVSSRRSGYVSVEKSGDEITLKVSDDGSRWSTVVRREIRFEGPFLLGIVMSAGSEDYLSEALVTILSDSANGPGEVRHPTQGEAQSGQESDAEGLTGAVIGPLAEEGLYLFDEETNLHAISAGGPGYQPYDDVLRFAYRKVSGDFRYVVQVHDFDLNGLFCRVGIMVRNSLERDSAHASMNFNGRGQFEGIWRSRAGQRDATGVMACGGDPYLAIEKKGDRIELLGSTDGESWRLLYAPDIDLSEDFLLGIVLSGYYTDTLVESIVEELSLD
ncbi:hypothetical protein [Pelagicoccus sp. SDUM812003]|uniref:hypothetical protein n=1 Tax=Pelagicoccus sp. SDUM812003 TaxID=3041267 RepID=UPI00280FFF0B|nr:hypothetical protein [Pelagicoccus sp. SDUM812003]MDQ8201374.1 hypothetical protein [Pelagicoccus sp. SDUM812003]